MSDGWLCPKCQSAHPAFVLTCPNFPAQFPPVFIPSQWQIGCACSQGAESNCPNSYCPRRDRQTDPTITVTS